MSYARTPELRSRIAASLIQPLADRFWSKVDKESGPIHPVRGRCWIWTAARFANGYGVFRFPEFNRRSHRVSWELEIGKVPTGLRVLHHCDNPPCVRPDHLFLGTDADNSRDKCAKGRQARGERSPRAILDENTVREIKAMLASGMGGTEIRGRLGVSRDIVYNIKRGQCWKHVT